MSKASDRRKPLPNTGSEPVPPGATHKAFERPFKGEERSGPPTKPRPKRGDAGERHATGEPGGGNLNSGLVDNEGASPDDDRA